MNYKHKYKKYQSKYYALKRLILRQNKYAIMMTYISEKNNILNICASANIHKQNIKNTDYNIDLVILCHNNICKKDRNILIRYFDRIIKDDLLKIDLNIYNKMSHYNKILLLDPDIMVTSEDFYDVFVSKNNYLLI